jgi:hypothetical protein
VVKPKHYRTFWRVKVEFKKEDFWIGVFWKRSSNVLRKSNDEYWKTYELHIWVCVIPMLPLHLTRYDRYVVGRAHK